MTEAPAPLNMTNTHRVGFAVVGVLLLIIGIYPLNSLVKAGIANQFETTKLRIVGKWQQAQLHTLPQLLQRLSNPQRLQELAAGEISNVEREMLEFQRIEPRLQQVYWLRTQGQAPVSLLGEQTGDALAPLLRQQANIQYASNLPIGHSLLDVKTQATGGALIVLIHRLRPLDGQALGQLVLAFHDADSLAQIRTVLPINDPMSFRLMDSRGKVALQLGDDATMESIVDQLSQHDNGLQFSLTQGATYQQTLAPIQSPDMGIHSLPSWRLVMHLPARVITMAFIENVLPMALAMLAATSLLWWLIFYGLWNRGTTKNIASQGDSEAIFPDKIYPWSFRTGPMQSLHANNLLLSLGYDVSNIDIKNRALLNTLATQEDLARLADVGSEVLEGLSEGIDLDLRLRHRRGYWVWYNILGRIVDLDKEGKPRRVEGVCIEMTKRKQDEQARANNLQNTRQRYQSHYQFIADISQRMQDNVQRALAQRAILMADSEGAQTVQRALQHLLSQIHQTRAIQ